MLSLRINGLDVMAEEGMTVLEVARLYGIDIPTLCYEEGLSPYGGCRLCLVEIGSGRTARLVTACTYPALEGLEVRTRSRRVTAARKMVIELLLARCPSSKTLQDLASQYGVTQVRFKLKNEDCILCGLCVRICKEQMMAEAIEFAGRGRDMKITTPFDAKSDACRRCGACMYICPACMARCQGPDAKEPVCNACLNMEPTCLEHSDDAQCFMSESACGTCVRERKKEEVVKKEG
ncbi:MAG: 2Fe-2S iron-sulfur cluster-binding protein [Thermoplasmata archaeon]